MTLRYCCYASPIIIHCGFLQSSCTKSFLFPLPFHPVVMMITWGLAGMPQHDIRHCFKHPRTYLFFRPGLQNLPWRKGHFCDYVIVVCLWKMGICHSLVISIWHLKNI